MTDDMIQGTKFDPWQGHNPPVYTRDGAEHQAAFARMKEASASETKDEVLWRYFSARQDDLRAASTNFDYQCDLEEALGDLLDAIGGGSCPSHSAPEEGCVVCDAEVLLKGGFAGAIKRRSAEDDT